MKNTRMLLFVVIVCALFSNGFSQTIKMDLLSAFNEGWEKEWVLRKFEREPITFQVETEDDTNKILRVDSFNVGAGLWRMLSILPGKKGQLSWRWKIDNPLDKNTLQRQKIGDDYAARVYVVFQPHLVSWGTKALCYVWAANAEIGDTYRSPYSNNLGIIVLQSGKEKRDKWVLESRDPIADYRKVFGRAPEFISAVAIVVDTDNSNQDAITWFDDILLEVSPPVQGVKKNKMQRGRGIDY